MTTTSDRFRAITLSGEDEPRAQTEPGGPGSDKTTLPPVSTTISGDDEATGSVLRPIFGGPNTNTNTNTSTNTDTSSLTTSSVAVVVPPAPAAHGPLGFAAPPKTPLPPVHVTTSEQKKPARPNTRPEVDIGKTLGRYRLDAILGSGAFSTVFRAHDLSLDLPVVVKVLSDDASPTAVERFRREIVFSRRVAHPGFSRIFELHEDDTPRGPLRYLTMEPVQGRTLGDLMNEGVMPVLRALTIARELCGIVAAAHDQGVVHGDLKPSNVMLRAGARPRAMTDRFSEPKDDLVILDFGAATADDVKDPGVLVGSVRYMAPELFSPDARLARPTPQSDVWALGVIAYACLTGRYPCDGKSDQDVVDAVRAGRIAAPSSVNAALPALVDAAVLGALHVEKHQRYPDCRSFRRALDDALGDLRRPSLWQRVKRWFR